MQIIHELEQTPRRSYTGSVGYINHDGSFDFNILIRSFLLRGRELSFPCRRRHRGRFHRRSANSTKRAPRPGACCAHWIAHDPRQRPAGGDRERTGSRAGLWRRRVPHPAHAGRTAAVVARIITPSSATDCAALALDCPEAACLHAEVCQVAEAGQGVVKIMLTRGAGARGYAPPSGQACTRIVLSAPLPPHAHADAPSDVTARWCALRLARQPRLAGIKHLNRLENVLARAEWDDPAIFEGLLCDDSGAVISGVMSNLFWVREGRVVHPGPERVRGGGRGPSPPVARGGASWHPQPYRPPAARRYTRSRRSHDLQQRDRRAPGGQAG